MTKLSQATLFLAACLSSPGGTMASYNSGRAWSYGQAEENTWQADKDTNHPTNRPTKWPTRWPTRWPTNPPTRWPTPPPTSAPTPYPTPLPSYKPTSDPTEIPIDAPTVNPTFEPTSQTGIVDGNLFEDIVNPADEVRAGNCPGFLDKSIAIDSSTTLHYAMVPSNPPGSGNGILCGRLEADNDGWIGLAVSENGQMIGSEAIIGVPDDESILKYEMDGKSAGGVTAMPEDKQTLRDTSIVQEDGKTIMTFTKLLLEDGEIPFLEEGANIFLHARGGSSLGYHSNGRISFRKDFAEDIGAGDSVAENPGVENPPAEVPAEVSAQTCPELNKGIKIDSSATLRYAIVPSNPPGSGNGLLCGRLEADNDGWIGLAFSSTGQMIGSEAIIGVPDDETCLKYEMTGKGPGGVTAMSENKQTLRDSSIMQEDGKTIMTFTKLLLEEGEIPILEDGANTFLHARGGGSLGYHSNGRVSFGKDFGEDRDVAKDVGEKAPPNGDLVVPPATESGSAVSGSAVNDCASDFCEFQLDDFSRLRYKLNIPEDAAAADSGGLSFVNDAEACDGCTISMEVIHEGEAWVAIAFSEDGKMVGSEAVIGIPGDDSVLKYKLGAESTDGVQPLPRQTLSNTSIEIKDGETIMKFDKILNEPGEIEVTAGNNAFLWAHGTNPNALGYHASRQSVVLNLSSGASEEIKSPNKAAWLAHGLMAFVAWGVCVPFAVQSSILRKLLPNGPIWFKIHRALNTLAYVLFILIFGIAVVTISKEGGSHFQSGHARMGLVMLILATIQVSGGVFRPHPPAADSGEEKTKVRKDWEIGHRFIGVVLLACAFWQMGKGIELYAMKYALSESYEGKLATAYWLWVGVMTTVIVGGGGYFRYRKKSEKKELDESEIDDNDGTKVDPRFEVGDV